MSEALLPKRFFFQFAAPCRYRQKLWSAQGADLGEEYRIVSLAELENRRAPVELRAAWSEEGLVFAFRVQGKQQQPWCRMGRAEDSDSVQIWIDTRDVHNVHRASRFCHRFLLMPAGGAKDGPLAQWMPINRAREQPRAIGPDEVQVRSVVSRGGYLLECFLAAGALTGFDPQEHPRLGFNYAVNDRELGEHTFTVGSPMPYQEDPSLWATLEMIKA